MRYFWIIVSYVETLPSFRGDATYRWGSSDSSDIIILMPSSLDSLSRSEGLADRSEHGKRWFRIWKRHRGHTKDQPSFWKFRKRTEKSEPLLVPNTFLEFTRKLVYCRKKERGPGKENHLYTSRHSTA